MPKCFTEWTVLPHDPIEKVSENLWRVSGLMNDGKLQRQMVLARMKDGRVVVHNGLALEDPLMKELEAWGEPSVLFVPNAFHRQDAAAWKQRYPKMKVIAPSAGRKRIARIVAVDAVTEEAPSDDTVTLRPLGGSPGEGVLEVRSSDGVTAVFTDALINVKKTRGFMGFLLSPTGLVAAPRISRLMVIKDKQAFKADLDTLCGNSELRRVMFGHGPPIDREIGTQLRAVIAQLS